MAAHPEAKDVNMTDGGAPMHRALRARAAVALGTLVLVTQLILGTASAQDAGRPTGRIVVPQGRMLQSVLAQSGLEQAITTGPDTSLVLDAALAPNGQQAVFARLDLPTRDNPGGSDLYVVPTTGGEPTLLLAHDSPGATLTLPIWAADGGSVLYTYTPFNVGSTGPEAQPRIERVRREGGAPSVVVREATSPAPSADGQLLAYLRSTTRGDALWVASADGTGGREVIPETRFLGLAYPRIAPDGGQIAVAAVLDLPVAPTPGPGLPRNPFAWQPSATGTAAHGLPWDIWLVGTDGSILRRLTRMMEDDPSLAWSPDGRWLALLGGSGLTLVDVSSGRTERLLRDPAFGAIDWGRE
jgi:Tol biopolymer transport system component